MKKNLNKLIKEYCSEHPDDSQCKEIQETGKVKVHDDEELMEAQRQISNDKANS